MDLKQEVYIMETNTNTTPSVENESTQSQQQPEQKLFSQEEVNEIVKKRVAKEKQKQQEAAKLAAMSEKEKEEYEYNTKLAELTSREEELNKREAEFSKRALLSETEKQLMTLQVPVEFANLLVAENAEDTKANIDSFKKQWDEAISKAVDAKIKSSVKEPKVNNNDKVVKPKSKAGMSLAELAHLKATNPEEFYRLK